MHTHRIKPNTLYLFLINQITDLTALPDERTLNLRDDKLLGINEAKDCTHRVLHQSKLFPNHE